MRAVLQLTLQVNVHPPASAANASLKTIHLHQSCQGTSALELLQRSVDAYLQLAASEIAAFVAYT